MQTEVNTIIIIYGGRAVTLGHGVYHPAIYIHHVFVSKCSFFAVVVIINLEKIIKVDLLQIDFHHGQGHTLFVLYQ